MGNHPLFASLSESTLSRINRQIEVTQGAGFRRHLGASVIGRSCPRQVWYIFRWARKVYHHARLLRLFNRGDREEPRLVKLLRQSGVHVLDKNPDTGEQFRIEDHNGHFGGSLDGKLFDTPEFPWQWILGEFKTHNDKSFQDVKKQGVEKSKFEHYVQAQIYMRYEKLPAAIYFAVNKNDDEIYTQVVMYDEAVALKYSERALAIINAERPPDRPANASPGWYICRFCDFIDVCHHHERKELNCRTCVYAEPSTEAKWRCRKFNCHLSEQEQRKGCLEHTMIPED